MGMASGPYKHVQEVVKICEEYIAKYLSKSC